MRLDQIHLLLGVFLPSGSSALAELPATGLFGRRVVPRVSSACLTGPLEPSKKRILGIIGVGTLTSAIVTGICDHHFDGPPLTPDRTYDIILSPRSTEKVSSLVFKYGRPVESTDSSTLLGVATCNQNVVDNSDIVVLGVLPDQVYLCTIIKLILSWLKILLLWCVVAFS